MPRFLAERYFRGGEGREQARNFRLTGVPSVEERDRPRGKSRSLREAKVVLSFVSKQIGNARRRSCDQGENDLTKNKQFLACLLADSLKTMATGPAHKNTCNSPR